MIDKVVGSLSEAVGDIHDGAQIAIGGFAYAGFPVELMVALANADARDLHLIFNGIRGEGITRLVADGRVAKVSAGFPFMGVLRDAILSGAIEIELLPQGTLSERLRAGGAGIAGFFTPTSVGTVLANGGYPKRFNEAGELIEESQPKEIRQFNGRDYVLEQAFKPDFGFVKAYKADRLGNLFFRLTARNFNPLVAMAARTTIVQAENIVEVGELDPNEIHLPGAFVDRIVHVPRDDSKPLFETASLTRPARATVETVGLSREDIAKSLAEDVQENWIVNFGSGMPMLAPKYIGAEKSVRVHMENGILGAAGPPEVGDPDLTDAGGDPVSLEVGAAVFDSSISFSIVRGGFIDLTVLGGMQVSDKGDLASFYLPKGEIGVGGAMDLVLGAKRVWVIMEHTDRSGNPKIMKECTLALTGPGIVKRIYTNLGAFSLESGELELFKLAPGVSLDYVREKTDAPFKVREGVIES